MKKVFKVQLKIKQGEQVVEMPSGAEILCVHTQKQHRIIAVPSIWFLCNPENPLTKRTIVCTGTGKPFPEYKNSLVYIGTYFTDDDYEVVHVFEQP